MTNTVSTNPLFQLLAQSDGMTFFILGSLLLMSIICWTVFLYKLFLTITKQKQLRNALYILREAQNYDQFVSSSQLIYQALPSYFLKKNLTVVKSLQATKTNLSEKDLSTVQLNIEQTLDDIVHKEESYLPILFSCASVAPLLGLFGTVWGLVHSFIRIAQKQSADIVTVAPGIAEALITTLAGLIVAVPALMMYHFLSTKVRQTERLLLQVAEKFLAVMNTLCL